MVWTHGPIWAWDPFGCPNCAQEPFVANCARTTLGPVGPIGPRAHLLTFRKGPRLFLQTMYIQISMCWSRKYKTALTFLENDIFKHAHLHVPYVVFEYSAI